MSIVNISNNQIKRMGLLFLFLFLGTLPLEARDINLDNIYFKKSSDLRQRLIHDKLEMYNVAGGSLVDRNVIFSGWTSGRKLIFIREFKNSNTNLVYEYFPASRIKKKIATLKGGIVHTKISQNGHYLFLKRMIQRNKLLPENEIVIMNLRTKKQYVLPSDHVYVDFTLSYNGEAILYEAKQGIVEYFPDIKKKRILLSPSVYRRYVADRKFPSLVYMSPNRSYILMLHGGGGDYKGILLKDNKLCKRITTITSASEIFWLDNTTIVFRQGYTGYYRVTLYNVVTGKSQNISNHSFNTNILFSAQTNIISYLQDGILHFYDYNRRHMSSYPVEGEDIYFSPEGNQFCVLYDTKLFLVKRHLLGKRKIEMKRIAARILQVYKRLKQRSNEWDTTYADYYIKRKIALYEKIIQ